MIKKCFLLAFVFLVAIVPMGASVSAVAGNLLSNPNFDDGLFGWDSTDNVTVAGGVATLSTQNEGASLSSGYVPITPKELLTFSLMAKAENILHLAGDRRASVSLITYRQDKSQLRRYVLADFSGSFDWKKMNGEFTTPYGAAFIRLNVRLSNTSGALHVDDFMLTLRGQPAIDLDHVMRYPDAEPELARRGAIVAGGWFNNSKTIDRFRDANFNFAWSQGTYLNQKMQYRWRESFTAAERSTISGWIGKCSANSLECYLALAPRGETPSEQTIYSSERDINYVVDKFEDMYALGVRNFGLNFDDLRYSNQDALSGADAQQFDNLGQAHYYFVNEVYERFILTHGDTQLMIVPLLYDLVGNLGSNEEVYLAELGALAPDIGMISTVVFVEDAQAMIRLTGRRHVVWDNQFAYAHEVDGATEYISPLYRDLLDDSLIDGYAFLPLVSTKEDAARISWRTAADYAWSPARYDPLRSYQLAVAKHRGVFDQLPVEPNPNTPASPTPTMVPTVEATPTLPPTTLPTNVPTTVPTSAPTAIPEPSATPMPTVSPTGEPTSVPPATVMPSPTTAEPTPAVSPTASPTTSPGGGTVPTPAPTSSTLRVTDGLQVLYTFDEGAGERIHDRSGTGSALDLLINDMSAVRWAESGLTVHAPAIIASESNAEKIVNGCQSSQSLSIEAWITPANQTQNGPARIVTLSRDMNERNFTLGQDGASLETRVRLSTTNQNGVPAAVLGEQVIEAEKMHVVFARNAQGESSLYINGALASSASGQGDLSRWRGDYRLALANELSLERQWLGEYHLVAVYCTALDEGDVKQNYLAGTSESTEFRDRSVYGNIVQRRSLNSVYLPLLQKQ